MAQNTDFYALDDKFSPSANDRNEIGPSKSDLIFLADAEAKVNPTKAVDSQMIYSSSDCDLINYLSCVMSLLTRDTFTAGSDL